METLLFDLDNTLYAYEPCNQAGVIAVRRYLCPRLQISATRFDRSYQQARYQVRADLTGQAASHSRLFYIQLVCERAQPEIVNGRLWQTAHQIFWQAYCWSRKAQSGDG